MGAPLYGLFLSFQAVAALGGLGDFGMGGAISMRAGRHLGAGEADQLTDFLGKARTLFLCLAIAVFAAFCVLSPWLPGWFGFREVTGSGSLSILFCIGGMLAATMIAGSYIHNLNHAALSLNVLTVPFLLIGQSAFILHWLCARSGLPLWVQQSAHLLGSLLTLFVSWWYLHKVQPTMAKLLPLIWDVGGAKNLLAQSGWLYLAGLGSFIYSTVDRLLVNAGFGPEMVPVFQLNNKLCELALFVLVNLTFVAMPKMTIWLASSNANDRDRVKEEACRLNAVQTLAGLTAALGYLMVNDWFMELWLGAGMKAPLSWQFAFAASLAVTAGSDVGIQLGLRTGERGIAFGGKLIGITALLNLSMSYIFMRVGSIVGIAGATVVAQSVMSLVASRYLCTEFGLPWHRWALRSWVLPVSILLVGTLARTKLSFNGFQGPAAYCGLAIALTGIAAWLLGATPAALKHEARVWLGMLRGR
jgi:O-antigen/teichoic acid export membrane protein